MRSAALICGLVLFLTGLPSPASAHHGEGTGAITGTVTDDIGSPAAGACVRAFPMDDNGNYRTGVAEGDGSYRLEGLVAGRYHVHSYDCSNSPDRWSSASYPDLVSVADGQVTEGIDLAMTRTGSVTGLVTGPDGAPLPGVCVSVIPASWGEGGSVIAIGMPWPYPMSDGEGRFRVDGVTAVESHVIFAGCEETSEYATEYFDGATHVADATEVAVVPGGTTSGIDASMEIGGVMTGRVTDGAGSPVGGICVNAQNGYLSRYATTAGDGTYTMEGLQTAGYRVSFSDCDWERVEDRPYVNEWYEESLSYEDASLVEVSRGESVAGIDASLDIGGAITGTVTLENDPDATVCVNVTRPDGTWAGSDYVWGGPVAGAYSVVGLVTGSYIVEFDDCGWGVHESEFYDDAADRESATPVEVTVGTDTTGIDAFLDLGPVADLVVGDVSVEPDGSSGYVVTATVTNQGTAAVAYGDASGAACPRTAGWCHSLGYVHLPELAPEESTEVEFRWQPGLVALGDFRVGVDVWASPEIDRSNNRRETVHSLVVEGSGAGVGL